MIQVEQLSKSYGDRLLFQDVSFSIAEGEVWIDSCQWYRKNDFASYHYGRRNLR